MGIIFKNNENGIEIRSFAKRYFTRKLNKMAGNKVVKSIDDVRLEYNGSDDYVTVNIKGKVNKDELIRIVGQIEKSN